MSFIGTAIIRRALEIADIEFVDGGAPGLIFGKRPEGRE
jgi:hypothetical protein